MRNVARSVPRITPTFNMPAKYVTREAKVRGRLNDFMEKTFNGDVLLPSNRMFSVNVKGIADNRVVLDVVITSTDGEMRKYVCMEAPDLTRNMLFKLVDANRIGLTSRDKEFIFSKVVS